MQKPEPAYSGDGPYAFICYSHCDKAAVYAEIRSLQIRASMSGTTKASMPDWSGRAAAHAINGQCNTSCTSYLQLRRMRDSRVKLAANHARRVQPSTWCRPAAGGLRTTWQSPGHPDAQVGGERLPDQTSEVVGYTRSACQPAGNISGRNRTIGRPFFSCRSSIARDPRMPIIFARASPTRLQPRFHR